MEAKRCSRLANEVETELLNHLNGKVLSKLVAWFSPSKKRSFFGG
jgi:hypothetical protein